MREKALDKPQFLFPYEKSESIEEILGDYSSDSEWSLEESLSEGSELNLIGSTGEYTELSPSEDSESTLTAHLQVVKKMGERYVFHLERDKDLIHKLLWYIATNVPRQPIK